ncbi:hypothetical protein Hanom_Chr09g00801841 [Helianthus anomalus]
MTSDELLKWTDLSYRPPNLTTIRYKVIYLLKPSNYEAETTINIETLGNSRRE